MFGLHNPSIPCGKLRQRFPRQCLSYLSCTLTGTNLRCEARSRARILTSNRFAIILEVLISGRLVTAGNCSGKQCRASNTLSFSTFVQRQHYSEQRGRWHSHNGAAEIKSISAVSSQNHERRRTTKELLELVDDYREDNGIPAVLPELPQRFPPPVGPHLIVSTSLENEWPLPGWTPSDPDIKARLGRLTTAIRNWSVSNEELFQLYKAFPEPQLSYLPAHIRHRLLHRFSVVQQKDETSMLRYFAILDDAKSAAVPLLPSEWNSAISFAARYVDHSTDVEVETALHLWKEMEQKTGHKGDHVTFNILFDVACKAGKFVLAEMIYKELLARGLQFDRYHHVTLIGYHGLRKNGDAVRAAYKNLVNAHEVVDTRVLNVIMHALINCEEANAAENVYERMTKAHAEYAGDAPPPRRSWLDQRLFDRSFSKMPRKARNPPSQVDGVYRKSILSPNIHTYRTLLNHFAVDAGQLGKVLQLHEDMKWLHMPLDEPIFLSLLRAFAIHGGVLYSEWNGERLEKVWLALLGGVEHGKDGLMLSRRLAVWALRAFGKCSGKLRVLKAWEEIKVRWNMDDADKEFITRQALRPIIEGEDSKVMRSDWLLGSG